jgi:adenylate kinase family enzyme
LLAQRGYQPDAVIELVLTRDEFEVVTRRRVELGLQPAGLLEVMSIRYINYQRAVEPLRGYYRVRGLYSTVSGSGTAEDVAARLIAAASGG